MSGKLPYPEHLARGYPPGVIPERRRILKCSQPSGWYMGFIGEVISVHYFSTFGAWDTKGRWLWYYDLSAPIEQTAEIENKPKKSFFKKLFGR